VNFKKLCASLKALFCEDRGRKGYHIESGFAAPALQWMENFERSGTGAVFAKENNAGKFFCGFSLQEKTPDHTYFSHLRAKIGTKRIAGSFEAF